MFQKRQPLTIETGFLPNFAATVPEEETSFEASLPSKISCVDTRFVDVPDDPSLFSDSFGSANFTSQEDLEYLLEASTEVSKNPPLSQKTSKHSTPPKSDFTRENRRLKRHLELCLSENLELETALKRTHQECVKYKMQCRQQQALLEQIHKVVYPANLQKVSLDSSLEIVSFIKKAKELVEALTLENQQLKKEYRNSLHLEFQVHDFKKRLQEKEIVIQKLSERKEVDFSVADEYDRVHGKGADIRQSTVRASKQRGFPSTFTRRRFSEQVYPGQITFE